MQQKFIPFSPFQPQTKSGNRPVINNITSQQRQTKGETQARGFQENSAFCPEKPFFECNASVPTLKST
jgi:hypothetical protein